MKRRKKVNGEKIFSIVITCAIVLTLAIGVLSVIKNSQQKSSNPDNIVDLNETKDNNLALKNDLIGNKDETVTANDKTIKGTVENKTSENTSTQVQTKSGVVVVSPTGAAAKYSFSENDTLKWPVKGDILLKYSMDSTIYFKTLGVYKTNPAILISSVVGTSVEAAASGIVESITTNEETGTTIVIAIGNEYLTTYGQLENVTLKKGTTVIAGDKIGTVAEPTKYYTKEGVNLFFKFAKGAQTLDPIMFLMEE